MLSKFLSLEKSSDFLTSIKGHLNNDKIWAISGVGAFDEVTIGYFKDDKYEEVELRGLYEVVFNGSALFKDGERYIHVHVVLDNKRELYCAHLLSARVGVLAHVNLICLD